ncbi:hypothetical protein TrVFT333_007641 [Trichoderma virens FT-333]|nr:hypothetical protein TrVFT333_007641 [Trichoderma virens FT-333]
MSKEAHDVNSKTREALLSELTSTLGPYVYEALAVHRSGEYNREKLEYYHTPVSCLALFEGHGDPSRRADEIQKATELELENIKLFHQNFVQPLVPCFQDWASKNFEYWLKQSDMNKSRCNLDRFITELSVVEKARVYRAFYRFQFSCNLYRVIRTHTEDDILNQQPYLDNFFQMLEPWEKEELLTVYRFAAAHCTKFVPKEKYCSPKLPCTILLGNGILVTKEEIDKGNIMRGLVILKRFCLEGKYDEIMELVSQIRDKLQIRELGGRLSAHMRLLGPNLKRSQGIDMDTEDLIGLVSFNLDAYDEDDWKFMKFLERLSSTDYLESPHRAMNATRFQGDRIPDDFKKDKFPSFSWYLALKPKQWTSEDTAISSLVNTGYVFWDETRFGPDEVAAYLGPCRKV